jgi:hypothetical protein
LFFLPELFNLFSIFSSNRQNISHLKYFLGLIRGLLKKS